MNGRIKDEIYVYDFLRLTDARFGDYGNYHIAESGVTARLGDLSDLADLSTGDAAVLLEFKREAVLDFPTTRQRLVEWVGNQGGEFTLPADFSAPTPVNKKPTTKKWEIPGSVEEQIRTIAEKWMREQRAIRVKKKWPGVIEIAKYVEGALSDAGITGNRGKFLDWETIKRQALTGITGRKPNGKK